MKASFLLLFSSFLERDRQTAEPLKVLKDLIAPVGGVTDLDREPVGHLLVTPRIDVRGQGLPGGLNRCRLPHAVVVFLAERVPQRLAGFTL